MRILMSIALCGAAAVSPAGVVGAQTPPAIRQLGRLERVTSDSLASAATVVAISGGRVLVNDTRSRRVLLLDSTLAHPVLVADTTDATGNAYGRQSGTLIRYRADTTLFIDIASLSMLVLGPAGNIVRVMAIPRPDDAQHLIGNIFGLPGFDARGRLVYHGAAGFEGTYVQCCVGSSRYVDSTGIPKAGTQDVPKPDSAFVLRVDLATHVPETVATIKIPYAKQRMNVDGQGYVRSIEIRQIPVPIVDGWAVTPDGSLAVVRGRDFHVDWLDGAGKWTSSPKIPFDWRRIDDERKRAIIDSSVKAQEASLERNAAMRTSQRAAMAAGGGRGGSGGRGGGGGGGGGNDTEIPLVAAPVSLDDVPDYEPPFTRGSVYADDENNLWIRTSTVVDGRPVYDIVNRRGELVDRVQLPSFRTIAGFGPGVIYMAVQGASGVVHLERARAR